MTPVEKTMVKCSVLADKWWFLYIVLAQTLIHVKVVLTNWDFDLIDPIFITHFHHPCYHNLKTSAMTKPNLRAQHITRQKIIWTYRLNAEPVLHVVFAIVRICEIVALRSHLLQGWYDPLQPVNKNTYEYLE